MLRLLRLCLLQVIIIGTLTTHFSVIAEETLGISIRGSKVQDQLPQYGPITPNDTLWNIATTVRIDPSLSVYQVMQSLYLNNPQAFAQENINHLVEGQILRIPPAEVMRAINDNSAKLRAETDARKWISSVNKQIRKTVNSLAELSVNQKDLDKAKIEINQQLLSFGESQKLQLDTIQSDLSHSIDAMQALLKENKELRTRLVNVNGKVGDLQYDATKSEKTIQQLNKIVNTLKDGQAKLKRQSFSFSSIYPPLLMTITAILIVGLFLLFYIRRNKAQSNNREVDQNISVAEKLSLDNEVLNNLARTDDPLDDLGKINLDQVELPTDEVKQEGLNPLLSGLEGVEAQSLEDNCEVLDSGNLEKNDLDDLLNSLKSLADESAVIVDTDDISLVIDQSSTAINANESFNKEGLDTDALTFNLANEQPSNGTDQDIRDGLFTNIESVDESILTQLLNDEKEGVEFSSFLNDKKVLTEFSSDAFDTDEVPVVSEVEDIQELDNLDFDELLANIEQESEALKSFDVLDLKDELNVKDVVPETDQDKESAQDFISVNFLLSDSLDKDRLEENYDKDNINVGLNDFPEFTSNVDVDVDEDEFGLAAKLDIANVYIEMGDLDNAEVILTDIVSLGNEQQQQAAQTLLNKINS